MNHSPYYKKIAIRDHKAGQSPHGEGRRHIIKAKNYTREEAMFYYTYGKFPTPAELDQYTQWLRQ